MCLNTLERFREMTVSQERSERCEMQPRFVVLIFNRSLDNSGKATLRLLVQFLEETYQECIIWCAGLLC